MTLSLTYMMLVKVCSEMKSIENEDKRSKLKQIQ